MTRHEKRLCRFIEQQIRGCNHRQSIEKLFRLGIISIKAIEALAIRQHIEASIHRGEQTGLALIATAKEFCCSYEKVRNIYYQRK